MKMWRTSVFLFLLVTAQGVALSQDGAESPADPKPAATAKPTEALESSGAPDTKAPVRAVKPLPTIPATLTQDQIKALINEVAEKDIENDKRQRDYTYVQREEEHKLDGKGTVKSTESRTSEVMILYEHQVERLIAKNDKPLSEKDNAKEEAKIQKIIEKGKNETAEERKKRLEKEEKDREHDREFVRDVSDAYNFRMLAIEKLDGRDTYVIDADPRPGFQPHHKDAKFLPKFRFRLWIDVAEKEWVKLDAQCIDTVSWGLFLARIHKGSRVLIETTRVNDEVWLPRHVDVKVDARLALLKGINEDIDVTYRDYKKFRTDAKIVGIGEVQEGK
jgi:hypothetical protein